jgi:hypothetical protein
LKAKSPGIEREVEQHARDHHRRGPAPHGEPDDVEAEQRSDQIARAGQDQSEQRIDQVVVEHARERPDALEVALAAGPGVRFHAGKRRRCGAGPRREPV